MRAYIISNVRKNASAIFPITVPAEVYFATFNRSQIPEITALLGNPNKPTDAHPRYASVLYKDGVIAGGNLFGSAAILKVRQFPFLDAISEYFRRYSKPYSLGQHQSLASLRHVVLAHQGSLLGWNSSRSPLGVSQWPRSL